MDAVKLEVPLPASGLHATGVVTESAIVIAIGDRIGLVHHGWLTVEEAADLADRLRDVVNALTRPA